MTEKKRQAYIKISEKDNVAITVDVVAKGAIVVNDVVAHQETPIPPEVDDMRCAKNIKFHNGKEV